MNPAHTNIRSFLYTIVIISMLSACGTKEITNYSGQNIIDSLMSEMTIEEKIGQLTLFTSGWDVTGPVLRDTYRDDIISGKCGNIFNAHTVAYNTELQRIAVEESRLGIPLLFGYDVIHGYKTIFPVPIAEACSWDTILIEKSARLAAKEAAAAGLNWTFNPMVDISRDPRWGRIAEGSGEDPYLGSLIARAKVRGIQNGDLSDPYTLAACVKHFAAYGAPQAGRDYSTVDMSMRVFREVYLPPYEAAIQAGAATVMTSFNELFGVPATASHFLLTELLRNELNFKGVVVTDYTSINELVPHGVAKDEKEAAKLAIKAGVDMDMQGAVYYNYLKELADSGKVDLSLIDQSVRRVLQLKYDLGLFNDPYLYLDTVREKEIVLSEEMMTHSLEAAQKSIVLLENKNGKNGKLLPLDSSKYKKIAVLGPLANNKLDILGSWMASGDPFYSVSLTEGLKSKFPNKNIQTIEGVGFTSEDRTAFPSSLALAKGSDLIILALGEDYTMSGEAASRTELGLPGIQSEFADMILKSGKPVVVIIFAGRPLTISNISQKADALIYAWQPGTRTGDALANILSGKSNPSAKLAITFPQNVGQIPIYYNMKNTGRPFVEDQKYTSKYIDSPKDPLYPFGYGLSYSDFEYSPIIINRSLMSEKDTLTAKVNVKNTGKYTGDEVVQLYIRDMVGTLTRPLKELKGFSKIELKPGESKEVVFKLTVNDLKFYGPDMEYIYEPGDFKLFIGRNSMDASEVEFRLKND